MASSSLIEPDPFPENFFLKICTLKLGRECHRSGRNLYSLEQSQRNFSDILEVVKGSFSPEQGGIAVCILKADSICTLDFEAK